MEGSPQLEKQKGGPNVGLSDQDQLNNKCPLLQGSGKKTGELFIALNNAKMLTKKYRFKLNGIDWYIDQDQAYLLFLIMQDTYERDDGKVKSYTDLTDPELVTEKLNFVRAELFKDKQGARLRCFYSIENPYEEDTFFSEDGEMHRKPRMYEFRITRFLSKDELK